VAGNPRGTPSTRHRIEGLMGWVTTRYAIRSIGRNVRRTALSVAGIAIGCVLALTMESINRGRDELFARIGAEGGMGHLRVVPADWDAQRDVRLRLADWNRDLAVARAMADVTVATARARTQVLLAMGTHTVPLELVGVDPDAEPRVTRFVRTVQEGRYLRASDRGSLVVGRAIAERLDATVGDEILATTVGTGGRIESAMLQIVGIVATGTEDIDASLGHVVLADLAQLTGRAGAGEIAIALADWRRTGEVRDQLAPRVAHGDEVLTWQQLMPDIAGHNAQDQATVRFISGIIVVVVVLGVASAQLAAVLDRRRELAVLAALGTGTWRLARIMIEEALILGLLGAVVGLAIGVPIVLHFAHSGLDLRTLVGSSWTFEGVVFEPVIYGDVGIWMVPYVLAITIGATLVASLYPAWFTARTDPATALRAAP
jgi:ABC-type lipoprotein release transport system permease subunit